MEHKKLNILFLCSWYPNPDGKSNGIFIKRHAQALSLKHNVTVVFVKSVNINEAISIKNEEENFKECLYFYPKINSTLPIIGAIQKFLKFKKEYRRVIDELADHSFDYIHVNTIFPAAIPALYALKKYPAAKLVITEHWSGYYPEDGNYKGSLLTHYTKKIISKAKGVFVISGKLKQAMLNHGLKSDYQLINNVVDVNVFKPGKIIKENNSALKILHVSSLVDREKNISGILSVADELKKIKKDFHLTIVGENSLEILKYKERLTTHNLTQEITFAGFKQSDEIASYMNDADVFLLFSNYEGMPVVILEALSCGLPVITTNVGEVKNMIPANAGIILKTNSIQECADTLSNFKREEFLDRADMHQYISNYYSPKAVCEQITKLYNLYF